MILVVRSNCDKDMNNNNYVHWLNLYRNESHVHQFSLMQLNDRLRSIGEREFQRYTRGEVSAR